MALSALAFATTLAILAFYAPRAYGLLQLASSLRLSEMAALAISLVLTSLSAALRPSTPSLTRRRQYIVLAHLAAGVLGLGGGIWILADSYMRFANFRFDVVALHCAAMALVISVLAISLAASLILLSPRPK